MLKDLERDATVCCLAVFRLVVGDRRGLAEALGNQPILVDTMRDQVRGNGVGATLRKFQVLSVIADVVGVAFDLNFLHARILLEDPHDVVEEPERHGFDRGLSGIELDGLEDLELGGGDEDARRAAVRALRIDAFVRFDVYAGVARVGHQISVFIRATASSGRAGFGRTFVDGVLDAIFVGVGTTLELGNTRYDRALIDRVEHAVFVVVEFRATVGVFELVEVLFFILAWIGFVEDPVEVVVRFGATVVVLELVDVFRLIDALVDVVVESVFVGVFCAAEQEVEAAGGLPVQKLVPMILVVLAAGV